MIRFNNKTELPERIGMDEAFAATEKLLSHTLEKAPSVISDITKHLSASKGKGIRTRVLLACSLGADTLVPREAVSAAAAVEIFHMATLVHDDIIDGAQLRRGLPSVQSRFGRKQAVIAGDFLLCLAFSTISDIYEKYTGYAPDFSKAAAKVCLGELGQHKNNFNLELKLFEYLKIISGKTAALFYIAAYAGAVLSCADEKSAKRLGRYGQYLGMIFQMVDDCKDYEFNEQAALKPVKNDLAEGVITLPLIIAMAKEPLLKESARVIFNSNGAVNTAITDVAARVCALGGVEATKSYARAYAKKAERLLAGLDNPLKEEILSGLLAKALEASPTF